MTTPEKFVEQHNLKIFSVFVPHSKSRNKHLSPCLNWKIELHYGDKCILKDIDYTAGSGHCPSYRKEFKFPDGEKHDVWSKRQAIAWECEVGYVVDRVTPGGQVIAKSPRIEIKPNPIDVISALVEDARVLDYLGFEDYAEAFGYNPDSISDFRLYQTCLSMALRLRNGLGAKLFEDLQTAFIDY